MVQGGHNYAIQPAGSQYQIKIDNQPQPLVVTLEADGKIAAPAVQQITGQKIVGYFVETNRKTGASTRTPQYGPIRRLASSAVSRRVLRRLPTRE